MELKLAHGFNFTDLYKREGLARIDHLFTENLEKADKDLFNRLMLARATPESLSDLDESNLILDLSPSLEDFIAELFGIEKETADLRESHFKLAPLYECKRLFVQRVAAKKYKPIDAAKFDGAALAKKLNYKDDLSFAKSVLEWMKDEKTNAAQLELAAQYAAWAIVQKHKSTLFRLPRKVDPQNLVAVETEIIDGMRRHKAPRDEIRVRDGFGLTDAGGDLTYALDHANYCIWCHKQGKDSCAKGMKAKTGPDKYEKSAHDVPLAGCPLEEKISEMNQAKAQGFILSSLAIITIDNPMAAATGHRICNDCMKSCIYQKQEPVDIPQVETRVLKDVLNLPWGVEIYSLLTRWNPLNIDRPLPRLETGKKVLVVGAGPAGFTLAHHLMNDGHFACLIDGLKIEPWTIDSKPIYAFDDMYEKLDERIMAGFGGVAEYGITVRWDKNFLKLIRLLLERRNLFALYGGIRFGGTITADQAFEMGFDHIAICAGAGKPTILNIPNGLARGVRAASDFLMALQLTGAAKEDSLANLQLRLPVAVIGGGLTAIDTATESLAYYAVQVEKFLARYEKLGGKRDGWTNEENEIADEFIAHAKTLRKAAPDQRLKLLQEWGGSTIVYRRDLTDAPSYALNHEEVQKALEEGIAIADHLSPVRIDIDKYGHARDLVCKDKNGKEYIVPARSILVAAGTQPNTMLAQEDPRHAALDGKYFQAINKQGQKVTPEKISKPDHPEIFMYRGEGARYISFFGDTHPSFSGNVVKAMGGAKQGYPLITEVLKERTAKADGGFKNKLDDLLIARIHQVNRLTPQIIEVVVKAPAATRAFQPGQFYRLQNYETHAAEINGTRLAMEGLAMTGAWVDRDKGLLSTIILEMGGSSSLAKLLKKDEPVVLMGPTGTATEIPSGENVLLIGGGLGNAVLFSIGQAMRANKCKVTYFAGYKKPEDIFKPDQIEAASDRVIWCSDSGSIKPNRKQDENFTGNMIQALDKYKDQLLQFDRIICIGSDGLMKAVALARQTHLKAYLKPGHVAIASINSPMQCMMKEICAQCLQIHVDPKTGAEKIIFSCVNQDQEMDAVDFDCLRDRLQQNNVQEKLGAKWIEFCLSEYL